jgi:hypothetical protein
LDAANAFGTWLGLVISIGGFAVAIWQIRKTAGAARAAADAAAEASASVRQLQLRDTLSKLVSLSREIESAQALSLQRRLVSDWLDAADLALGLALDQQSSTAAFSTGISRCRDQMRECKVQLWTAEAMKKPQLRAAILTTADEARSLAIARLSAAPNPDGRTRK